MNRLPFDDDPRYEISSIHESCRKYIVERGTKYEQFKGVVIYGEFYDLRSDDVSVLGPRRNWQSNQDSLDGLLCLLNLRRLEIGLCQLRGLTHMPLLKNLTRLLLNGVRGSFPTFPKNLESLQVWDGDPDWADYLKLPESIADVDLYSTEITDLQKLENLPNLKRLNLGNTPIHREVSGKFSIFSKKASPNATRQVENLRRKGVKVTFDPTGAG